MSLSKNYFLTKSKRYAHSHFPRLCSASSGYGLRTSGHGAGSISFKDTTGEIGFNRAEGYINPHFREDEWRASLQHVIARYSIKRGEREK